MWSYATWSDNAPPKSHRLGSHRLSTKILSTSHERPPFKLFVGDSKRFPKHGLLLLPLKIWNWSWSPKTAHTSYMGFGQIEVLVTWETSSLRTIFHSSGGAMSTAPGKIKSCYDSYEPQQWLTWQVLKSSTYILEITNSHLIRLKTHSTEGNSYVVCKSSQLPLVSETVLPRWAPITSTFLNQYNS